MKDASDYPMLYSGVYEAATASRPNFPWHSHATSPHSSQAFCLSAFVPLWKMPTADVVLNEFVHGALPAIPFHECHWTVKVEFECPATLGETGGAHRTSIDVLLEADNVVVCVESKFVTDAAEALGHCPQPQDGACRGFHGRGSDPSNPEAWCHLDVRAGDPRPYWTLAQKYLTEEALGEQTAEERCPLLDTYQLMRNFFFAAEWAETEHKAHHAAIVLVPSSHSAKLSQQVEDFRALLRPEQREFVTLTPYESYVSVLEALGGAEGVALAAFLSDAITREERLDRFTWHAGDVEIAPPA
jgi:hypothetical protein